MIEFFVPGTPVPQPRVRPTMRFGKGGKKFASVWMPPNADEWRGKVRAYALAHAPAVPFDAPMSIDVEFVFERPHSHYHKTGLRKSAPLYPEGLGDLDNLMKSTVDAMKELGYWRNDCQIVRAVLTKTFGDQAGAFVRVGDMAGIAGTLFQTEAQHA